MRARPAFLVLGAAALALWALSRTRGGSALVSTVVDETATGALVVASRVSALATSRGIRNNNPGNVRWSAANDWQGQIGRDDAGFCIFDTPANGVRALARVLRSYARRGIVTTRGICATFAPATENDTDAYTRDVARQLSVDPDERLDVDAVLPSLAEAIIRHENGRQPYESADVAAWVYL